MRPKVAIIDYGLGNLFSIRNACSSVGLDATVTQSKAEIMASEALILPGMGAFQVAMESLRSLDLIAPLRDFANSNRPMLGVCLGLQLFFTESYEFGRHPGLDLISGTVVRFDVKAKVPHIGWSPIHLPENCSSWSSPILQGVSPGASMYFVHSFYAETDEPAATLARTQYAGTWFASAVHKQNLIAFQFHPERSGTTGLMIYRNFAAMLNQAESLKAEIGP